MENIKLFFQIYFRPASVMSEILDKGSWLFAAACVLLVAFAFQYAVNSKIANGYAVSQADYYLTNSSFDGDNFNDGRLTDEQLAEAEYYANLEVEKLTRQRQKQSFPFVGNNILYFFSFESAFFVPLISLSIFYVPTVILLMCIFAGIGNFGVVLSRDYAALATCSLMSWAAAHLPFAIAGVLLYSTALSPPIYLAFWILSGLLFGVFMIFALRTVFGANYGTAILVVCVAWLALSLGMYVFKFISPWLFSPFLLFFAFIYLGGYLGGEVRGFGNAFRQRQNFKRFLHNATVNPKDADAHVQLGLIYLQRKQESKALEHFNKAVEIDAEEIDANYELGKIARKNGEFQKALDHFTIVADQNDKYSLSEVWREIGATYLEAGMFNEAKTALEKFINHRPVDSEGLYYLGKVYTQQNEPEKAREVFEQAIESARNSPDFRRRELKYWSKLAQKEI
jgi:tetratricopeptide (TPR) repeat protein